ncbi:ribosomal protein L18e/L15P [Bisporella sp. PMI_857]|nr:ribosomal protein L18e/L15P [Bisporella sp. PMI_857]
MPPRLSYLTAYCRPAPVSSALITALFIPILQVRNASILSSLSDTSGAYNKRIRRGRGPSSGKGKTSGRGHKGQKQHGKTPARFQGGQTPDVVVNGVRGFVNHFTDDLSPCNLDRVQLWIDQGRLDPTKPITVKELVETRCIHGVKDGVKLLARGKENFKTPINILVSRASSEAIKAVEEAGGKITTRYYTHQSIRRLLQGESESSFTPFTMESLKADASPILSAASARPFTYRLPDPTSRKDLEYYRDEAHRGYLSHLVEDGHGPSLFYKTPGVGVRRRVKKGGAAVTGGENRIW